VHFGGSYAERFHCVLRDL